MAEVIEAAKDIAAMATGLDVAEVVYKATREGRPGTNAVKAGAIAASAIPLAVVGRETVDSLGRAIYGLSENENIDESLTRFLFLVDFASSLTINVLRIFLELKLAAQINPSATLETGVAIHFGIQFLEAFYNRMRGRRRIGLTQGQLNLIEWD